MSVSHNLNMSVSTVYTYMCGTKCVKAVTVCDERNDNDIDGTGIEGPEIKHVLV